jgi:hypothetical protein
VANALTIKSSADPDVLTVEGDISALSEERSEMRRRVSSKRWRPTLSSLLPDFGITWR